MKWNLIFKLSLFGLAMAFATVYCISSHIEPLFWLAIFIICAYIIAKNCSSMFFLNGFMVSIVNSIWITAVHILLFGAYISKHAREAAMMGRMPMPTHPRLMMLIVGPLVGVLSGLVLGLFAFIASKIVKRQS
jgi:uncharacterized membrane protein